MLKEGTPCSMPRVQGGPAVVSAIISSNGGRGMPGSDTSLPSDKPEATASTRPSALIRSVHGLRKESKT